MKSEKNNLTFINVVKLIVIIVGFTGGIIFVAEKVKDRQITKDWERGMEQMYERGVSSITRSLKCDTVVNDTIK